MIADRRDGPVTSVLGGPVSNAPERKEGSTAASAGTDRRHGLKLVEQERCRTTPGRFRIEIHDNLLTTVCTEPSDREDAVRRGGGVDESKVDGKRSRSGLSTITAFVLAGILIGYFFGKHR